MIDTPPPSTLPSEVRGNPLLAERRRAERAEEELEALRVRMASLPPAADRPPLSKRLSQAVQATPPVLQWAALIGAVAGLLQVLMPTIRELMGLAVAGPLP